ncbi:hypothetical protein GCM10022280_10520 [Sphingomonas swuensis]|uniref:Sec-independent protein translocase protein TatA n=1 Tax=Sphingomonas swuensis TaxID=977800 RepID=A0ABP7SN31_9SPHN
MGSFSLIHWLVLGLVILLLFGGNRFSTMMGDVAKGLKGFKQGMADDPAPPPSAALSDRAAAPPIAPDAAHRDTVQR